LRADVRRRAMRLVGSLAPVPGGPIAIGLSARPELEAPGLRALFHASRAARGREAATLDAGERALVATLLRLASGPRARRAGFLGALAAGEVERCGACVASFETSPEGLRVALRATDAAPLVEADGADLVLDVEGFRPCRATLSRGEALLRAGAGLVALGSIDGLALEFGALGRIDFAPPEGVDPP
jgi:hypothetical protein